MPKRKSKADALKRARRELSEQHRPSTCPRQEKAPYRLSMFVPGKPVEGDPDNLIHTRPLARDTARDIVERHKDKVYLVSEEVDSNKFSYGEPLTRLPELAIAMEVVPLGNPVISFQEEDNVAADLEYFQSLGAHVLNRKIVDATDPLDVGEKPPAVVTGAVRDMLLQFEWTSGVPKRVSDWINLRFYAMGILNCCYIGRGAPVGVNLKEQADMMCEDTELLGRFVDAISSSNRTLPDFGSGRLPAWQEKMLWEARIDNRFQKALKQSENYREYFHYPPLAYQFPELAAVDEEFRNIRELMRHMIYAYEKGEENNIPDVIWTDTGPQQMSDALDEIGIVSSIDAYLCGVPFEDVLS